MKAMILQVIVHHTDDSIGTFTYIIGLINKKIQFLWNGSTANTKDFTFSGFQKLNWTWLYWTCWIVNLLEFKVRIHIHYNTCWA